MSLFDTDTLENHDRYLRYLKRVGVGSRDRVADSRRSYVTYLLRVQRETGRRVTPSTCSSEEEIESFLRLLEDQSVSPATISNCRTALRRYSEMVREENLRQGAPIP